MNYQFDENDWEYVLKTYEEHKAVLMLITCSNIIKRTLDVVDIKRTMTSTEQVDYIIALLLTYNKDNKRGVIELDNTEKIDDNKIFSKETCKPDINQIIEQLRLFVKRIYEDNKAHDFLKDR